MFLSDCAAEKSKLQPSPHTRRTSACLPDLKSAVEGPRGKMPPIREKQTTTMLPEARQPHHFLRAKARKMKML
jgi:hypothetical protein